MPDFEFYRSNAEVSYPFEKAPLALKGYFVDAYVVYRLAAANADAAQTRLKLSHFDPRTGFKRVTLQNESSATFIDLDGTVSGVTFKKSVFGAYIVYEWQKVSTIAGAFTTDEIILRLVVLASAESSQSFPLIPTDAFLVSSLVNHRMSRVRKLGVKQPDLDELLGLDGGVFILNAGNNVKLSIVKNAHPLGLGLPQVAPVRAPTRVLVDIIPGAGTGQKQVCLEDTNPIRAVNGQTPNAKGNLFLYGEDCIRLERPIDPDTLTPAGGSNPKVDYNAHAVPATLKLRADCKACCDCADYGNTYSVLAGLWGRAKLAAKRIEDARDKYNRLVQQLLLIREVSCPTPTLEQKIIQFLNVITRPDFHYAVGMTVMNNSGSTFSSLLMHFSIDGDFVYTERSGFVNTPLIGQRQVDPVGGNPFSVTIPMLKHGETAQFTFEGRYYHGPRANRVIRVTGSANTPLGVLTKTVSGTLTKPLLKT